MSGGLAPSKSTVYISNLPFSLTNNDIHKIFQEHGKIVKVTILRDRISRRSKGVAFVLFLNREDAEKCAKALDGTHMFGRNLKASIASDNGRSAEFIRRRNYPDKSRCYECGEEGHLSYQCPSNVLGEREPPPKKQRVRNRKKNEEHILENDAETDEDYVDDETLSTVIAEEQALRDREIIQKRAVEGSYNENEKNETIRKKIRKDRYFSDEESSD